MVDTIVEIFAVLGFVAVMVLLAAAIIAGEFTAWTGIQAAGVMWQAAVLFLWACFSKKIEKK